MIKIDMQSDVLFGDEKQHKVTSIEVKPISFQRFVTVWGMPHIDPKKPEASLQKMRILEQAHFMIGKERYVPSVIELGDVDFKTIRAIIDAYGTLHGEPGKVMNDGDGLVKPILYKLGSPIPMQSKSKPVELKELEFQGTSYRELEDVLAAPNELQQALALIQTVARPVGVEGLTTMLGATVDQISLSDGITIMNDVLPRF